MSWKMGNERNRQLLLTKNVETLVTRYSHCNKSIILQAAFLSTVCERDCHHQAFTQYRTQHITLCPRHWYNGNSNLAAEGWQQSSDGNVYIQLLAHIYLT